MVSQELKSYAERIGQLYPILVDYFGNIIDGEHRFGVDEKWRRVRLEHIEPRRTGLSPESSATPLEEACQQGEDGAAGKAGRDRKC